MRNALILTGVLLGLFWALATLQGPDARPYSEVLAEQNRAQNPWRRTENGWERMSDWKIDNAYRPAAANVHPVLVAGMELLLCLGGLVAFAPHPPPGRRGAGPR